MNWSKKLLTACTLLLASSLCMADSFRSFARRYGPNSHIFNAPQYYNTRLLEKAHYKMPSVPELCEREERQQRLAAEKNARILAHARAEAERKLEIAARQQQLKEEQHKMRMALHEQERQLKEERAKLKAQLAALQPSRSHRS